MSEVGEVIDEQGNTWAWATATATLQCPDGTPFGGGPPLPYRFWARLGRNGYWYAYYGGEPLRFPQGKADIRSQEEAPTMSEDDAQPLVRSFTGEPVDYPPIAAYAEAVERLKARCRALDRALAVARYIASDPSLPESHRLERIVTVVDKAQAYGRLQLGDTPYAR